MSRISFDSEKWREASPSDVKGLRIRMMDDLVSSKRLIRKSRLEVEQQLGDPESTTPNEIPETDLLFRVGPDIHFGFDTVCLHLKMDELDLVKDVFVVFYWLFSAAWCSLLGRNVTIEILGTGPQPNVDSFPSLKVR